MARSETATKAAVKYGIDLLQAAMIAEFDGDDDAVGELLETAERNPAQLAYTAERLRQTASERRERIAYVAVLEGQGYRVWSEPGVPWTRNLHWLRDAEGQEISPEAPRDLPRQGRGDRL